MLTAVILIQFREGLKMDKNSIVIANRFGIRVILGIKFNKDSNKFEKVWDLYGLDNDSIYFTEEDAIKFAKYYQSFPSYKDIRVIQPLVNDEYFVVDYSGDEITYQLKKQPF